MTPATKSGWLYPAIGAGLLAVWIVMLFLKPAALAWDFTLFYAAGKIEGPRLYNLQTQQDTQRRLWEAELSGHQEFHFSPFLRPAFYRVILTPLSHLPYWTVFAVWLTIQAAALVLALARLARRYGFDPTWYLLLPLCPYVTTTINWGQDTALVLLAVVLGFELLVDGKHACGGALLALALVKWNLFAILPLFLLARGLYSALAGFTLVAALEAAISIGMIGTSGFRDYLSLLNSDYADYLAPGMPSLRGLLLLLHTPQPAVLAMLAAALIGMVWIIRRLPLPAALSLAVSACVFLAYHTMIYDLLFLLLPILVLRQNLETGWRAAVTVFLLSPVPNQIGKPALAMTLLLFIIALCTLRRSAGTRACRVGTHADARG